MASCTVRIFSASSSGISISKASSNAMTNSTVSRESAPRSSTNDAFCVTSPSSTPSCSTIICFTFSSTAAMSSPCDCVYATMEDGVAPVQPGGDAQPPFGKCNLLGRFGVLIDVIHGILNRADLLRIFIRNLQIECFLESHHQFNLVQ